MRILVINPNTTVAMTEQIGRAARAAAASGTEIIAVNPMDGPVSIEGCRDYWPKSPKATPPGFPHIACFDDTGLEAAHSVSFAPVIGISEAAFHLASMLGHRFSVVTTLSRSIAATRKQSVEVRTGRSLRQGASMRTSGSFTR
jgi:allantoin racemase